MKASEAKAKPRFVFVLNWPVTPGTGVTAVILGLANAMKDRYQPEYLVIGWSEPPPGQAWVPVPIPGGGVRNALAYLLTLSPRLYRLHRRGQGRGCRQCPLPGTPGPSFGSSPTAQARAETDPQRARCRGSDGAGGIRLGAQAVPMAVLLSRSDRGLFELSCQQDRLARRKVTNRQYLEWSVCALGVMTRLDDAKVDIGCPYIVNVAAFVPKKAHDVLLNAFALIRTRWPTLKLVIIGDNGPARAEIERRMGAPDLRGSVVLLSDVKHEEVLRWLRQGACFVLASRDEPFGIAVLEAGLARVPVVATAVGGIPEYAKTGVHAILCRPDDPRELAAGVLDVLSDPISAARRVDAFYTVAQSLTWDRCWSLYAREAAL